ncbi:MAG: HAMP domain-containing histidine kinase [Defluviitaleaceae bacterium]|nr:HAMP domain-containing histidine kinase [Defluviitaleaceae bacterium]
MILDRLDKLNKSRTLRLLLRVAMVFERLFGNLRTLRWKLFLSYVLIGIIPIFVMWGGNVDIVESHLVEQRAGELRSLATFNAAELGARNYMHETPVMRGMLDRNLMAQQESRQAWIMIVDNMATVIFDSLETEQGNTWATAGVMQALGGTHHESVGEDGATILQVAPIFDADGEVEGAIMIAHVVDFGNLIDNINSTTITFITILILAVLAIVVVMAQWLIRPMRRILASADMISKGQLEERIDIRGRNEFSALGLAINDMTDKLARAESARQEFVSNVSHELKTPLSSIKVLSESLLHQGGVENEMHREFLTDITSEVDRMTDIVNELLTLVRMDEVELPLNISSFNLNRMLEDVIKRLRPLARQREVEVEFADFKQVDIDADEMKLSLAISNLVENAIKYNRPDGNVRIVLDADNKSAFITVADNGVGISEENQAQVFTRFFRVDKGRDRETGGTGLGLSITHKTILLHKGSIKLTSKEEEGSTFVVRVPLQAR